MQTAQWTWPAGRPSGDAPLSAEADLVLAFGPRGRLRDAAAATALARAYPKAQVVGCSSGGDIQGLGTTDGGVAVTAVSFERTAAVAVSVRLAAGEPDDATGERLARLLPPSHAAGPLAHVLTFADGVAVNGSTFVGGLERGLPEGVAITGGLAADDDRFERTPLWANGPLGGPGAVAVGLYGAALRVGYGAAGGWDAFGPRRVVTRSDGHVLHELDGAPALDLYRRYLGPHAESLPASGLRFPLAVRVGDEPEVIRTLLGTDERARTMTFAGDLPEGATARLMRANPERLIEGAAQAARQATASVPAGGALALLVSCVGRKWVLGQRADEEVEAAAEALGGGTVVGFYSYGEISPSASGARGQLHNQTMTITTLSEG